MMLITESSNGRIQTGIQCFSFLTVVYSLCLLSFSLSAFYSQLSFESKATLEGLSSAEKKERKMLTIETRPINVI